MTRSVIKAAVEWIDHETFSIAILKEIHARDGMNNVGHDNVARTRLIKQFERSSSMPECAEALFACGRQIVLGWSRVEFFL